MRFDQCSETCTTDCGHCKGRPVEALRADNERLARRLAGRFEEAETLRAELAALRQQLDEARGEIEYRKTVEVDLRAEIAGTWDEVRLQRQMRSEVLADRDRLLVVYRAAEAWAGAIRLLVEIDGDHLSQPSRDLLAALDGYWIQASDAATVPIDTEEADRG